MRRLLANRNARLYIAGQTLSTFGDSALWLALGIWVKMLTGSASAAGLSFFMFTLGTLGGPVGGVLADRLRRRPLLIATNLATATLVMVLLLVHVRSQVWLIYVVMLGYGLSAAVLGPAQTALLQSMVPAELLGDANSAMQTTQWGLRLATPLLGAGLLAAFGAAPVIIGDAVTFLVAVASLLALRVREERPTPSEKPWLAEALAGARHIRDTPVLRQLAMAGALAVIAFGFSETAVFAVVSEGLHRPDAFLGVLISTQGAGAVAAGVTAAPLMRRLSEGRVVALGLVGTAVGFLLQTASSTPAVLAGCALIGSGLPWISVGIVTLFQRRTPAELMGRTDAALGLVLSAPQTIAIAVGAALIAVLDYRILLLAIASLAALASAYLLTRPEHRRRGGVEPAVDTADTAP
ncbi:MFS transporter [Kitasatospora sp. NBC_01287]|uniref:MFS transporter n=1 Tax=Kitasatospora sp. NBC_01287 TaxID=2903573 RepID=UPI0022559BFA|nr:MFS transporter [Kitasatospora sp. NBC_01287]MCX4750871.1 MFS transporter [Kitasatospora sp. NBC_01287]